MQAMFIDVDGTLSSPCYKVNGKFQIAMSDVQWADYCIKHREDTYAWCRPVMQVKEYAMKAKEKGTKLYVLTTSGTKIETAAKRRFLTDTMQVCLMTSMRWSMMMTRSGSFLKKQQSLGLNRRTVSLWRIHTAYFCRQ